MRAALVLYAVTLQPAELLHPGGQPVTQTLEFTQGQQTRTGEHLPTRARRGSQPPHPPIGARGLPPQNTCVPNIPMRLTRTRFSAIDLAVALPTPTGPPLAL